MKTTFVLAVILATLGYCVVFQNSLSIPSTASPKDTLSPPSLIVVNPPSPAGSGEDHSGNHAVASPDSKTNTTTDHKGSGKKAKYRILYWDGFYVRWTFRIVDVLLSQPSGLKGRRSTFWMIAGLRALG